MLGMALVSPTRWEARCAARVGVAPAQVERTAALLREQATVPFVVRYRQEATGGLDEAQVRAVAAALRENEELEARRKTVLKQCEKVPVASDVIQAIRQAEDLSVLEDLYTPFKAVKSSKAQEARDQGLEPLALRVWNEPLSDSSLERMLAGDGNAAGVLHLLAQKVSEHVPMRAKLRHLFLSEARLHAVALPSEGATSDSDRTDKSGGGKKRGGGSVGGAGSSVDSLDEAVGSLPSHRVLKLNRAERNKQIRVSVHLSPDRAIERVCLWALPSARAGKRARLLEAAAADAFRRLLQPSMARFVRKELSNRAEAEALLTFSRNLERLLLQRPLGRLCVLGADPGFRTGSKLAVVDEGGRVIHHEVIYPLPPHNKSKEAALVLQRLVRDKHIKVVAVGTGCGGRELMEHVAAAIRADSKLAAVQLCAVSEAGASVLSVSAVARTGGDEGLDVGTLGAASIARRLQDPLAELVKVEPRSIGVGMYQHDLDAKRLSLELEQTVQSCVCAVGVDVNTASAALISRVAGLTSARAAAIVAARPKAGFRCRADLLSVPSIGPKSFEQAAGFLRISGGSEPLDSTAVHPESYSVARKLLGRLSLNVDSIQGADTRQAMRSALRAATAYREKIEAIATELSVSLLTLQQVVEALLTDWRDPRDSGDGPLLLGSELHDLSQIKVIRTGTKLPLCNGWGGPSACAHELPLLICQQVGQILHGIVRNVTPFGGFVDVGLKEAGLVHISELSTQHVADPHDVIEVGQLIAVKVVSVDVTRQRLGLSLKAMTTRKAPATPLDSDTPTMGKHRMDLQTAKDLGPSSGQKAQRASTQEEKGGSLSMLTSRSGNFKKGLKRVREHP